MNNKPEQYTQEERAAARRAIERAKLVQAGFVISHLTHALSEMSDAFFARWQSEEVWFVRMLLRLGIKKEPFKAMVKLHSENPIAFQYGRRFYFN